jgi:tetratricopeptide (TPR) repeat protein
MNINNIRNRFRLSAAVYLTVSVVAAQAQYVILNDGTRMEGTSIRVRSNGDVTLSRPGGDVTYTRGQYREAWGPRPAEMDQARQLLEARQFDQAIPLLEDVLTNSRNLGWDQEALMMIGRAQAGKGDYSAAISSFERLFRENPSRREHPATRWAYFNSLLGAEQYERLEPLLDDLIAKGDRAEAARAQIMRGDIKKQRGLTEEALLDYLRTVILFDAVRDVQPEALFKAGEALDEMRDPRANSMYERIVEDYSGSPFAQQARGKL